MILSGIIVCGDRAFYAQDGLQRRVKKLVLVVGINALSSLLARKLSAKEK